MMRCQCIRRSIDVSCVCVTRGRFTAHAISQFLRQDYTRKELVIVHQGPDSIESLIQCDFVKFVRAPSEATLGELRNIGAEAASGTWVLQWDDDDSYAPSRIGRMLAHARQSDVAAVALSRWYIYHAQRRRLYLSSERLWEGSALVRTAIARKVGYPPLVRGEDSAFFAKLERAYSIAKLDAPELYLYTIHGQNCWDETHFDVLCALATPVSEQESARVLASFR